MTDEELKNIADKIWPIITTGDCIAWIGSGLSITEYPGWTEIVSILCEEIKIDQIDNIENATSDQLIDKAEECKSKNKIQYYKILASNYGGLAPARFAYEYLLNLPFKAYVTTNYDPLLRYTSEFGESEGFWYYPDELTIKTIERKKKPKFYIHGLARINETPNGENLILARSDFNEAYQNNGPLSLFLSSLFQNYPILFIGCRLEEGEIQRIIDKVIDIKDKISEKKFNPEMHQRLILLPSKNNQKILSEEENLEVKKKEYIYKKEIPKERLEELNIQPIEYNPQDKKNHWEIECILRHLCNIYKYKYYKDGMKESEELTL